MSYENPQVPHEVNVSRESVLAEFLRLVVGLALVVLTVSAVLYFAGGALARFVPYSAEQRWVGDRVLAPVEPAQDVADAAVVEPYLQQLVDDLARHMDLPGGMRPVVHWSDEAVPNAFATLGGHIVVTRGLCTRMPSENALAMVLAHELAHLSERDPISAVGGSATLALAMVLLGGSVDELVPHVAHAVQLGYSRRAERHADELAVEAVIAKYGHAGGAAAVFEVLADYAGAAKSAVPTLLSTHPADEDRIARVKSAALGWDPARQPLRPLRVKCGPPS
ncbi:MAG: M48 family metallopeptidase [Gammaproteobacteria bacterium]|nr:M48 family metallopeptidase [Gammaproteobacteria bacterium]